MKRARNEELFLDDIDLEKFMMIIRDKRFISFSDSYKNRINTSRRLIEKWVDENKIIYGVTTGFGANSTRTISQSDAEQLQRNIVISHSTSVGRHMSEEEVRAVMLMILLNIGTGYSGVRLETLERYRNFLNLGIYPFAPRDGSVGYLSPEAHIAMTLIGEGMAVSEGEIINASEVLNNKGLEAAYKLSYKEGLALVSGTTSVTGLAAIALYDIIKAVKTADIISAMTIEVSKSTLRAFDDRVMKIRLHETQNNTAKNIRRILKDSEIALAHYNHRLQDALSIRCVPQIHGAAKKTLYDAKITIENEMKSSTDNPVIWYDGEDSDVISCGNPDSSFIGLEMDSAAIAATMVAKMSERRNNRLIDGNLNENPWFLVKVPGLNSGLMIPQYTQAGLLNEMRILSTSATIDNTPTCGNQEDYVANGYNSAKKAIDIAEKLEYILAIELLSAYQSYQFLDSNLKKSSVTEAVYKELNKTVPILEEDAYLYPYIEHIRNLIHDKTILDIAEAKIGEIL
ncbi:HAL/PAL/TAL family ammonia-lyase [Microaceticoccus formicicus]|uniref:HAL/PAL/TAL family ammonia-lyase n=1 Tax=Microaceticoccus formicicus TaxID=3118105 RepID=UPI003CD03F1C|nr:aromatic amino acid ammonia-lyase [Peptoniphilaceae bacterium AMB_02]